MKRVFCLAFALCGMAHADVKLPAIFADHMVLQRGKPDPVWGWADPGEEVTVKFGGQTKTATAGADGAWKVTLDALEASSDPAEMQVAGKNSVSFKDVLVGEVWLCSGQSNMGFTVSRGNNAEQEIAAANDPLLRLFSVPLSQADEPQTDIHEPEVADRKRDVAKTLRPWAACTPENVGAFTAVGYFFGRELRQKLNVPVGLINSSWGGTRCEAWTSKPALKAHPDCKAIITAWDDYLKTYDPEADKAKHEKASEALKERIERIKAANAVLTAGAAPQVVPGGPRPWEDQRTSQGRPGVIYNAMIHPLGSYALRGAIWYQGEANKNRAEQYLTLLPTMILDWRKQWHDEFSFYIAQLAGFGNGVTGPRETGAPDPWAELQWAQLRVAINAGKLKTPKCGLAVTNDIGEENDIHPKDKQDVGHRLALQALVKDYKKTGLVSGGPIFGGGSTEGNKFVINFSNGVGLKAREGKTLQGFIIAGEDKVWKPAKATVVSGRPQVRVWNEEIKKPVAVRYAWASWSPEANLVNKEGLPTSVFRTDKWDLSTKGVLSPFDTPVTKAQPVKEEVRKATTKKAAQ